MLRRFRNHDRDLERALRAARPTLRDDLLDSFASRLAAISPPNGRASSGRPRFAVLVAAAGILAFAAFGGLGYTANAAFATYQTIAQTTHQGNDSHGNPASGHNYGQFGGWGNDGDCFTHDDGDCGFHHNPGDSQYGGHYPICHRTGNPGNPWVLMYISADDIDLYAANNDLIPAPPNGCPNPGGEHAHHGIPYVNVVLSPTNPTATTIETATTTLHVNGAVGTITYLYVWRLDGDKVQTTGPTTSTTDTFNITGHNAGAHDGLTVEVTPTAGSSDVGPTAVDGVNITNTAPVIASVTITPASPTTNQLLTTNVVQSDADGDTLTDTYQWNKNGNPIVGQTGPTLDLSIPGNGDRGDVITVSAIANDGIDPSLPATSPPVTVVNTPPTATVTLAPATPNLSNTVTATPVNSDVDGDTVTDSYSWTVGGTPVVGAHLSTLDLSTVAGAHKGEAVVVTVTPNDGTADGIPATASVTIGNSPPVITSIVLSPSNPHTNDTVSSTVTSHDPDGDPVNYTYQWTKNGTPIPGATGATLNLATAGNGDRGDIIGLQVTPNDGTVNGAVANAATTVTVDNTPPTATVSLSSPLHGGALATATATDADVDGDTVLLTYVWKVNGTTVHTTTLTPSLTDTYTLTGAHHTDTVTVTVTPYDGHTNGTAVTATGTVDNTPPTATVTLAPASPNATQTLTATPTNSDVDGDTVTDTYSWSVGGTTVAGATSSSLNLAGVAGAHKGQLVVVTVTPNDGHVNGTAATASVTIANSPPVITSVSISPASAHTNDLLSAVVTSTDPDSDPVTYTYQWTKNGNPISGATGATLNLATPGNGDRTDQISVIVTPNDGTVNGAPVTSSNIVTIDNSAPTATVALTSPLNVGGVATATATDADIDPGDSVTLIYVWKVNGTTVRTSVSTTSLTDTYTLTGTHPGDTVTVTVTPNDTHTNGSAVTATGTVADRAPSATVTLAPATPNVTNTVTATPATSDPDGDAVTVSYSWTVGGTPVAGATLSTLNLAGVSGAHKGQAVVVTATPSDGTLSGTPANASVTIVNAPPVIDSVTITPASPNTNSVLSAAVTSHDPDSDAVSYTYQWTKNGSPIAGAIGPTLNLATAGNGNAGDLISVNVTPNDGTVNGATFNAATSVTILNTAPTAAVTLSSPLNGGGVATATATDADIDGDTVHLIYVWKVNGATVRTSASTTALTDTYTLTGAHHGDTVTVTVTPNDGTVNGTAVTATGTVANTPPTATISLNSPLISGGTATATATDADVDSDAVTLIYVWKVNGTIVRTSPSTSALTDTYTLTGTHHGDIVTVTVTPNDGTANGTPVIATGTIADTAPVIDSVVINPTHPHTNDTVSATVTSHDVDGDTVTYTYQWTKNGNAISGATGSTLNLATAGNGDRGDIIGVTVTPNDGTLSGSPVSAATVTVDNTPPTATVSLSSPLTVGGVATATATDADIDSGDDVSLVYVWTVNGATVRTSPSTTALTDTYTLTGAHPGAVVLVTVTPNDTHVNGTAATATGTIVDHAPSATVSLSPSAPNVTNTVTATPTNTDSDGDTVTDTYSWTVGGLPVSGTSNTLNLATVGSAHKGQVVTVTVTPNDGTLNGTPATASVTIANAPPVIDSVTITPASPHTNDLLSAAVTSHDPDSDTVTYTYQWTKNGSPISGATASTLNLATTGNGNKGDVIGVNVTPNDGTVNGAVANAASTVTIADTAPTATVTITGTASTGSTLTAHATDADIDGDAVTLIYVWKVNGTTVRTSSSTSSLTDTYTLGTTHHTDTITVTITPSDGTLSGTPATATTAGADQPPTATVSLSPSSPYVTSIVTATPTTSDPDGDAVTVSYAWTVGGNPVSGTSNTLNLAGVAGAHKGQVVTVMATPNDGIMNGTPATASVTIVNSPPVIDSVTLSPNPANTNDTITTTVTSHDADGDPVTYSYQWFDNGVAISGQYGYQLSLLGCMLDKGDVITVKVTPNDGTVNGAVVASAGDTIADSAPVATVSLSGNATTGSTLTATATKADADGDSVTLIYVWTVNGVTKQTSASTSSTTNTYIAGTLHKNDVVTVTVTPNDGTLNGAPASASKTSPDNPPSTTVAITGTTTTGSTLTATAAPTDPDGDPVTLVYVWSVNGTVKQTSASTSSTTNTYTLGTIHKGDTITVSVTPNDGTLSGTAATASVTGANNAPTATVSLSSPLTTGTTATATATDADIDGDTVHLVYLWKVNGTTVRTSTSTTSLTDTYTLTGTHKGDTVTVSVTPNDGTVNGTPATATGTVANTPPTATVSLSPSAPVVANTVTATATKADVDGDTVTLTYAWSVGGTTVAGATGSTLNLATVSGAHRGQAVQVTVTPNDGTVNGTPATASVTIANSPPIVDSVTITPSSPVSNSVLTANVTGHDPDGDTITYSYQWTKNGASISGATSSTLNLATAGNGDEGDVISVKVTPNDGTVSGATVNAATSVTVLNSPPTATVALSGTPTTGSTLTSTATDADIDSGDTVHLIYVWKVAGTTVRTSSSTTSLTDTYTLTGAHKGNSVTVTVTPNDGTVNGTPATASTTVADSPPVVDSVTISPSAPTTNSLLTANVTSHDPDGDTVTYTYQWTKNGSSISGATSSTLNLATAGNGDTGDVISVKVTPNDGTLNGATVSAASSVTVLSGITTETVAYTGTTSAVYSESMTLSNTLSPAVTGANVTYSWPSGGGGSAGSVGGPANGSVGYAPNWIGPKTVTTSYAGDSTHSASSTTTTVTVSARSVISVSGSPNSSSHNQSVAIHAHLTENGTTFPSGTSVTFTDGSTTLGSVTINSSGDAILNVSSLSVGTHTIAATYAGSGSASILSSSASYTQTVTH